MIIYLIGAISNDDDHKYTFQRAEDTVRKMYPCADVINPAKRADYLPEDEYKLQSLQAVRACDMVVKTWTFELSEGARWELAAAMLWGKEVGSLTEVKGME
jgi:hypothetical protein